jgi:hypothetical protein
MREAREFSCSGDFGAIAACRRESGSIQARKLANVKKWEFMRDIEGFLGM